MWLSSRKHELMALDGSARLKGMSFLRYGGLTSCVGQEVHGYLRFLKRSHAAAQHGAAVPADFQEDLLVVSMTAVLCRFQHRRQGGSVDDQAVVLEFVRQPAEKHTYTHWLVHDYRIVVIQYAWYELFFVACVAVS